MMNTCLCEDMCEMSTDRDNRGRKTWVVGSSPSHSQSHSHSQSLSWHWGMLLVLVLLNMAIVQASSTVRCQPHEHNLNGQKCCQECAPGTGVHTPCTPSNNTICHPCRIGESYSPQYSHIETCHPCQICPHYSHTKHMCNQTHDTACECDRNYHFDESVEGCRPCDSCPMGYGVKRQCNSTLNTVCWQCPPGTYSDRRSNHGCRVCTLCGANQLMLQMCNSMQDTVCVDLPSMKPTDVVSPTALHKNKSSHSSQSSVIPIYCAILGLVVLILLLYVIVRNCRRQKQPAGHKKVPMYSAQEAPVFDTVGHKQGSDSGVCMEQDPRPVTGAMLVRELSISKKKALENMLHGARDDQGGWRNLARELGYSASRVASFETRAMQDGMSPAKSLFLDWSRSEGAIVNSLMRALYTMGRDDIVKVLCGDTRDYAPQPRYILPPTLHNVREIPGQLV